MDPNALSSLDPKLRETYERVMGTNSPITSEPGTPAQTGDNSLTQNPALDANPATPGANISPAPASVPSETPNAPSTGLSTLIPEAPQAIDQQPKVVTISDNLPPNPAIENQIQEPHGHLGLIKVFYVLGTTVFFVIYIFFWMKIFNFNLPI